MFPITFCKAFGKLGTASEISNIQLLSNYFIFNFHKAQQPGHLQAFDTFSQKVGSSSGSN